MAGGHAVPEYRLLIQRNGQSGNVIWFDQFLSC